MAMARLFTKNLQQRVVTSLCENNSPIASRTVGAPKQRWEEALRRFSTASEEAKASEGEREITVSEGRQKSKLAPRKRRGLWRSGRGLAPSNLGDIVPRSLFNLSDNLSRMLDNLAPSQLFGRLKEDDKCYKLRLEVPGLSKEDLKITLEGGFLNIKGEHKEEEEEEEGSDDEQWGYRSYGYYNSSLLLPPDAKLEDIKAELKNGVLHLTIPRKENQAKDVKEVTIQ